MKRSVTALVFIVLASSLLAQSEQQLASYLKRNPDADANGDGKLTREEARAHRQQRDPTRGDNLASTSEIPPIDIPLSEAPLNTVSLKSKDGVNLDFAYRKPRVDGRFPVIIFFHGGGGTSNLEGLKRNLVNGAVQTRFLEKGFMTVQSTRRPYWPSRNGKQPTGFADAVRDAALVVAKVKEIPGVDPERIILYGGSGGGILAIRTAAEVDVSHVVAGEPATVVALDPREGKPGGSAAYRDVMANPQKSYGKERQKEMRAWMEQIDAPVLVLQGKHTGLYNINFEILIPEMKKLGKDISFIEFPGLSHGFYWGTTKTGATVETVEKIVKDVQKFITNKK
jgi:dipeptidyl aminopeptidase/acylaminoacyl peptidase